MYHTIKLKAFVNELITEVLFLRFCYEPTRLNEELLKDAVK
jgi:hypothetical protein